jgi:hypothetical protein
MAELHSAGIPASQLERLARLLVVVASNGTIVTAIKNAVYARRSRRRERTGRERAVSSMLRGRGHRPRR